MIFQLEKAPDTGKLHFQGMIMLHNPVSLVGLQKLFIPYKPHFEVMKGTPAQAWEYCEKLESAVAGFKHPWTIGDKPTGQGARSDIHTFREDAKGLKDGTTSLEMLQDVHCSIEARHMKYFDRVVERNSRKRSWKTECHILYGDAGTGKTTAAWNTMTNLGITDPFVLTLRSEKNRGQLWWDGYDQHDMRGVIVNEMAEGLMTIQEFNELTDAKPYNVPIKGGMRPYLARIIIFTSNDPVQNWFNCAGGLVPRSIERRIDTLTEFRYDPFHMPNEGFTNVEETVKNATKRIIKSIDPQGSLQIVRNAAAVIDLTDEPMSDRKAPPNCAPPPGGLPGLAAPRLTTTAAPPPVLSPLHLSPYSAREYDTEMSISNLLDLEAAED